MSSAIAHGRGAGILLRAIFLFMGLVAYAAMATAVPEQWRREGWNKTDFSKSSIAWSEIMSGGPPKDGIPAIDFPRFVSVDREATVKDDEAVIGVEINGDARAYPLRILMWHEIVNDIVGGVAVTVTYCPLCNAAIAFERTTPHGVLDFGTTGKLRHSDLVMYDRQTESWWQQFTGEAIAGQLTGAKLRAVPARLEAFRIFRERSPRGRVLIPNDPASRDYGRNPYEGYDTSAVPFFHRGEYRDGLSPMTRVVVVRAADEVFAVTLTLLRDKGRVTVGPTVLSWRKGQASALDHATVAGGHDIGNVTAQRISADGHDVDIPYDVTFAFVIHAFHPDHNVIQSCTGEATMATRGSPRAFGVARCGRTALN